MRERPPLNPMRHYRVIVAFAAAWLLLATTGPATAQQAADHGVTPPAEFLGFEIGTDGELARYPMVLEYLQHLAARSDRVKFAPRGTTTNGNPYVLVTISAKANLDRLDRLIAINHRLADPRGLTADEARTLTHEGVPFYFLYATIHSTEVGNGQSIINIAHRLATEESPEIREILENAVVLLVPSQNPDGQVMVIDHWYDTRGTGYDRVYPDLYHRYTGHDDNRDWFMFTQKETRLAIDIHREFKPQITHDMHQMGSRGARIFVPPFRDPHDPNIHPLLLEGQAQIGRSMTAALTAAGKTGVINSDQYDLWTPARQYMLYHGQPRILTEIASARLADPYVNPAGPNRPLGPQQLRTNFPAPYDSAVWRLSDIVEYGEIVVYAALEHLAKYRTRWMENFHRVHLDWVNRDEAPYAFVVPADQRDPFATYELLEILHFGEIEIDRARAPFTAGGKSYPAGSRVINLAQPYGAFAKTMLERQVYPDLRYYDGGPPIPPYDVTAHTLGLLMGVDVDRIDEPVQADLERLETIEPRRAPVPSAPAWGYAIPPGSNAGFLAASRLQAARVPVYRTAAWFEANGRDHPPGTWLVPPGSEAASVLERTAAETGLVVAALDAAPPVDGHRLREATRVGLWRAANNMPGGWMMWLFEQYELNHAVISSLDFDGDLSETYDVIVLPSGTSRANIVTGTESAAFTMNRGAGRTASGATAGAGSASGCGTAGRWWHSARPSRRRANCWTCRSNRCCRQRARAAPRSASTAGVRRGSRRARRRSSCGKSFAAPRRLPPHCANESSIRRHSSIRRARCSSRNTTRSIRWATACRMTGRSSSASIRLIACCPASTSTRTWSRVTRSTTTWSPAAGCSAKSSCATRRTSSRSGWGGVLR